MITRALLDGDILAYRPSVMAQSEVDWDGDGSATAVVDVEAAIRNAFHMAETWSKLAKASVTMLAFSPDDGSNFRKLIYPEYKAHRKGPKPEAYWQVVDALKEKYPWVSIPYLEADDVLAIYSTNPAMKKSVIASVDKDFLQVPGFFLNPTKHKRPIKIPKAVADHWWMKQTLMGDPVDGYAGCPDIGDKRSDAYLGEAAPFLANYWDVVVRLYEEKGLTEADAIMQARLARLLQFKEYDPDEKVIKLWNGPHAEPELLDVSSAKLDMTTAPENTERSANSRTTTEASANRTGVKNVRARRSGSRKQPTLSKRSPRSPSK